MRLYHFSEELFVFDAQRVSTQLANEIKPIGLWVSVDTGNEDGWEDWCKDSDFRPEALQYCTEVFLKPEANILYISTPEGIDAFTKEFSKPLSVTVDSLRSIKWIEVARRYDGIIIAPYVYQRRLTQHTFWYYGWDCASGCIWNGNAVLRVEPRSQLKGTGTNE